MPAPAHSRYTLHDTATHCLWSTGNQCLIFYLCIALQVREPDKKRLKIDQGHALEDSVFRILH